ncbi:RNase adapter RapZ [Streptomyces sp. BRB081]|uniref:RapZ C-terminal domain-containing protein n=1 Tax=Streptomyces sp. BRB081 TaxID=2769544 RepID=UPI0018ACA452|nr:RNase adapter RapZ [Streptomyces sp. BRB081]MBL3808373.1 hypothetical protein [Streptomyces sp. BRB081]
MRVPNGGEALRNPADDPTMRCRTGLDPDVRAHVLATPGVREVIERTTVQLLAIADEVPVSQVARLPVACQRGRHRSVAVEEEVAHRLWTTWGGERGVDVEHHHIDHGVLPAKGA